MKEFEIADIQEDIRINLHGATVVFSGTPLWVAFEHYIQEFGLNNIYSICSLVYSLGKMHGKREERARKRAHEQMKAVLERR